MNTNKWYHNKKAGLVQAEGQEGYSTCIAPHAEIRRYYAEFCEAMEDLESVIAKAEGRGAAS